MSLRSPYDMLHIKIEVEERDECSTPCEQGAPFKVIGWDSSSREEDLTVVKSLEAEAVISSHHSLVPRL